VGRGGGPSGPGGAPSVLPPLEPVAGGFVATVRSSGSLSSMGRDHGSIGSDRESVLRSLCRSWVGVEAEEAMSRNLLRRRGFVPHHDRTPPCQFRSPCPRPSGRGEHGVVCERQLGYRGLHPGRPHPPFSSVRSLALCALLIA
jgi:hypothetical protein